MEFLASEIADMLHGTVQGNPAVKVHKLVKIEEGAPGGLSFLSNPKYTPYLYRTAASVVIVDKTLALERAVSPTLIRVDDARSAFSKLLQCYNRPALPREGVEPEAFVSDSAQLGQSVYIGAFAYIGANARLGDRVKVHPHVYIGDGVVIGEDTELFSGLKVYFNSQIGRCCILHSNAVIGADGFGFAPDKGKAQEKIPQTGHVVLEDFVEIGACTTIDRATLGVTRIRKGAKLDNQIQIGHNVEVGAHTVIASQVGVAGSTKIGDHCLIGGQVGIAGHLNIGSRVKIAAQSGITCDLPSGAVFFGSPAMEAREYRRSFVHYRRLPDIVKRLEAVEAKLRETTLDKNV